MIIKPIKGAFVGLLMLGLLVSPVAAVPARAQTSLNAQIAALLAQVAALQAQLGVSATVTPFVRDLTVGASGADVTRLQQFLIARGHTIPAGATGYFGAQTQTALAAYQAANSIAPAVGYFGPITRARVNTQLGSATPTNPTSPTNPGNVLKGGAGSLDDADFISSLNNEEVGEDQEDVEIAGLEIEADSGSDIELTAVTINFDQGSADEDFEDYASDVSIWFDGEEVARIDADEFEDDDFEQSISLDRGAIIRRGDTGELVVAVSGIRNLDSQDIGDTWTIEFASVRFRDAQGATITDTTTGDIGATRTFSFESFANAANAELRISNGDDEINDSRVISVSDNKETDDEDIFSFNAKVDGKSDLNVDEIVVDFDFTGTATALDDIFSRLCLEVDGDKVGCETVPNDDSITFEDLDLDLEAGEKYEFTVVADILDLDNGTYSQGDTVRARITSTERDAWVVEDESGEDLANNDKTGTANSDPISLFESGITIKAVSATASTNDADTIGKFRIVVDVTAFGDDQYIYRGADNASSTVSGFVYTVYRNGEATSTDMTLGDILTSNATTVGGDYFRVNEGQTRRFTLTVTIDPDTSGLYTVELDAVRFDPDQSADDSAEDDRTYDVPSSQDFETPVEYLVAS